MRALRPVFTAYVTAGSTLATSCGAPDPIWQPRFATVLPVAQSPQTTNTVSQRSRIAGRVQLDSHCGLLIRLVRSLEIGRKRAARRTARRGNRISGKSAQRLPGP